MTNCPQVTGGSSGIGKCVAIEAAKAGANVTIVARDTSKLKTAVEEIGKYTIFKDQRIHYLSRQSGYILGNQVSYVFMIIIRSVSVDLSQDYSQIESYLNDLVSYHSPVYALFSCVGTAICGTVDSLSIEDTEVSKFLLRKIYTTIHSSYDRFGLIILWNESC